MGPAERIFDLAEKKFSQKEFAAALGVKPQRVSEWKRGLSSSYQKYLPQIATVLGTTTEYLLTGDETYRYPESREAFEKMVNSPEVQHEITNVRLDSVVKKYGLKKEVLGALLHDLNSLFTKPCQTDVPNSDTEAHLIAAAYRRADERTQTLVRLALGLDDETAIAARGGTVIKKPSPVSAETLTELSRATETVAAKENDQF